MQFILSAIHAMANLQIEYIPLESIELATRNPRLALALQGMNEVPGQDFMELALSPYARGN